MSKITIDGTEYEIPVMKFATLKKAFPIIERVSKAGDPLELASGAIEILSLAMIKAHPEMTAEWLEDSLTLPETSALAEVIGEMVVASGLVSREDMGLALAGQQPGEAPGVESSTAISTPSSPNSSQPDAPEATGT